MARVQYQIYVVELSKKVFTEHRRFREANPQFNGVLECLYVGMTSKTPKERFLQHKKGHTNKKGHNLSSSIVRKYGSYLRPSLYNHIQPVSTRAEALRLEENLALELRRKRYAVWYNWLLTKNPKWLTFGILIFICYKAYLLKYIFLLEYRL